MAPYLPIDQELRLIAEARRRVGTMMQTCRRFHIDTNDFFVLLLVYEHSLCGEDTCTADLAELLNVNVSTVYRRLNTLVRAGLLDPGAKLRRRDIHLTPTGVAAVRHTLVGLAGVAAANDPPSLPLTERAKPSTTSH